MFVSPIWANGGIPPFVPSCTMRKRSESEWLCRVRVRNQRWRLVAALAVSAMAARAIFHEALSAPLALPLWACIPAVAHPKRIVPTTTSRVSIRRGHMSV